MAGIVLTVCGFLWACSPISIWCAICSVISEQYGTAIFMLLLACVLPVATILLLSAVKSLCQCSNQDIIELMPRFMHKGMHKLLTANLFQVGLFACIILFAFGLNWQQFQEEYRLSNGRHDRLPVDTQVPLP